MYLFFDGVSTQWFIWFFSGKRELLCSERFSISWNESTKTISITLVVNTLAFIYPHISLTTLWFFDLYDSYPIVKASSKRDLFVKMWKSDIIQIVKNDDFCDMYSWDQIFGDINPWVLWNFTITNDVDYEDVFRKVSIDDSKTIAPMYIKKPNIS